MIFKVGTLVYDNWDEEWGIIVEIERETKERTWYKTVWCESVDHTLSCIDLEADRFEIYETV